jgi:hypothetical protein
MIGRAAGDREMASHGLFEIAAWPMYRLVQRFLCHHDDEISYGRRAKRSRPHDFAGQRTLIFHCKKCGRTHWVWEKLRDRVELER